MEKLEEKLKEETLELQKQFAGTAGTGQAAAFALGGSTFAQQYLKGVLENMENGRKAVLEKVKFVIPTMLGTFVAEWALAYVAIDRFYAEPRGSALLICAAGISFIGIRASQGLDRVMEATYDFYVASVIHARIVFGAVGLHHHWISYVDRAARQADKLQPNDDAATIRKGWQAKRGWLVNVLLKCFATTDHRYEDKEKTLWSARILEQWKAQTGTLLHSYQHLLGLSILAHFIFILVFAFLAFALPSDFKGIAGFLKNAPPALQASQMEPNLVNGVSLMSVSSNLSILNEKVLHLKTNMQAVIGP